jgi:hypothetical protein
MSTESVDLCLVYRGVRLHPRCRPPRRSIRAPGMPGTHPAPGLAVSGHSLLAEELLSQDVGVPAVLGQLAQQMEVHPAQRERPAPTGFSSRAAQPYNRRKSARLD